MIVKNRINNIHKTLSPDMMIMNLSILLYGVGARHASLTVAKDITFNISAAPTMLILLLLPTFFSRSPRPITSFRAKREISRSTINAMHPHNAR